MLGPARIAVTVATLLLGGMVALSAPQIPAVRFVDEKVLAWGDPETTLRAVLAELAEGGSGAESPELISVLAGEGAPLDPGKVERMAASGVELELRHGGQTAYWWLLAAE